MAVSLSSWTEPTELDAPRFNMPGPTDEGRDTNMETQTNIKEERHGSGSSSGAGSGLVNALMSMIGNLGNGGGLDIGSVLGLLDNNGKSDSMLKVVLPLLLNGGLGGLFGGTKKSPTTPADDTINLDDYKRVK